MLEAESLNSNFVWCLHDYMVNSVMAEDKTEVRVGRGHSCAFITTCSQRTNWGPRNNSLICSPRNIVLEMLVFFKSDATNDPITFH